MPKPEGGDARGPLGEPPPRLEDQSPQNQWLALLNLGWVFVATMALTVFGGLWLDKRYGTAPLFILIGVFLGFAASGYSFYVTLRKLNGVNGDTPAKHQE